MNIIIFIFLFIIIFGFRFIFIFLWCESFFILFASFSYVFFEPSSFRFSFFSFPQYFLFFPSLSVSHHISLLFVSHNISLFSVCHNISKGKEWDVDTEEFVHYNLSTDASRTLSFSDESLRAALKDKGSLAAIFNVKNGTFIILLFLFLFSLY